MVCCLLGLSVLWIVPSPSTLTISDAEGSRPSLSRPTRKKCSPLVWMALWPVTHGSKFFNKMPPPSCSLIVSSSYTPNGLSKAKSAIEAVQNKMGTLMKEQAVQDAALKGMPEWSMIRTAPDSRPTSATEKQERVISKSELTMPKNVYPLYFHSGAAGEGGSYRSCDRAGSSVHHPYPDSWVRCDLARNAGAQGEIGFININLKLTCYSLLRPSEKRTTSTQMSSKSFDQISVI